MTNEERQVVDAVEQWRRSGQLRDFQALQRAADALLESKQRWQQVAGRWDVIRDRVTGARITVTIKEGSLEERKKAVMEVLDQLNAQVQVEVGV